MLGFHFQNETRQTNRVILTSTTSGIQTMRQDKQTGLSSHPLHQVYRRLTELSGLSHVPDVWLCQLVVETDPGCQLSSNALVSINVVTPRRARLVPGWVTVLGRINHLGAEPGIQVYSAWAIPRWVGAVSTQLKRGSK